ncbi:MAG: hypothetical protein ACRDWB_07970, partial [Acidimicrobiales bacterium]
MVSVGEHAIRYDIRGLAEPDIEAPLVARVEGETARFDAAELSPRQINLELRRLVYGAGITE